MKPNILLIMTDQQQAKLRKAAGYSIDTMPNLDALGQSGVDFERCYTPNPTCAPARTSLFTGRYPSAHKVRTNHNLRDARYHRDLIDVLKSAGYMTALCGKNHTYFHPGERLDFQAESDHLGKEWGHDCEPDSPLQAEFRQFLRDTDFIDAAEASPFPIECQLPYRNVSSCLRFLDKWANEADDDQPFFAWVSFAEPHNPYQVPEPYFSMFPPESLPPLESASVDLESKGHKFSWIKGVWDEVIGDDPGRIARMRASYHGMLRLIDDQVGRLLKELDQRNLADNTIVIYVSDHGDFAGEYGMMRKGTDLPDCLTRVPMIWRVPGLSPMGRTDCGTVNLCDIFPTLCDLLDLEIPFGVQGRSIRTLLEGGTVPGEFDVGYSECGFGGLYWDENDGLDLCEEGACRKRETFDCLNTWTQCGQIRMAVKGDWKIQCDMLGNCYLYNLAEDPAELCNLADNPAFTEVKADMLRELTAAILRADDPLPPPHHRYRVKRHPKNYMMQTFRADDPGVSKL